MQYSAAVELTKEVIGNYNATTVNHFGYIWVNNKRK